MGSRAKWKGPFVDDYLLGKAQLVLESGRRHTGIKTWSRRSVIIPPFVGLTFMVYNGKKFIPVFVSEDMIGHKLGEFSPSRIRAVHGDKGNKKTKK